ncbi:hypothetical protein LJR130_003789 [Variovorax sp. LjRoot130]|uniref:hypothetical protein n=1 Tax=Variovorax sp. LjRoot130 TaxID=3342261 RepID=UPI003ECEA86D
MPQTTALTIQLTPEPKVEQPLLDNPTFLAATVAFGGVAVTVLVTSLIRFIELRQAAKIVKGERDHSRELANDERENSRAQAKIERENAAEQAKIDRQHASDEAQRARLMAARKDVYASLVENYIKTQAMFAEMPRKGVPDGVAGMKPLHDLAGDVQKTWLLSEVDTAYQARELHSEVNELFFALLERMLAIGAAKTDVENAERVLHTGKVDRATAAPEDQARIDRAVHQASSALDQKRRKLSELQDAFIAYHVPETHKLFAMAEEFLYLARLELGLEGSSAKLRQQTIETMERAAAALSRVQAAIKEARGW